MKTVAITGVAGGIGQALVQKFLAESYFVIGTYNTDLLSLEDNNFAAVHLDLADTNSIADCVQAIAKIGKKIDILINNAGIILVEADGAVDIDFFRQTLEVNLIGLIDFTNQILPFMTAGGHIVNISSRQGSFDYITRKRNPSYNIGKAALNMFTRTLSIQLGDTMTVSSVHPGAVKTRLAAADADMQPEEAAQHIYNLAISQPESGQFWFKGEKFPW